jgi:hypothetical protein
MLTDETLVHFWDLRDYYKSFLAKKIVFITRPEFDCGNDNDAIYNSKNYPSLDPSFSDLKGKRL